MSTPENNNRKWLVAAWPGMGQVGSIAAGFLIHALGAKPVEDLPARGYFDMGSVLNVVSNIAPPAAKIVDELGLKGIKSVTFASGFDGPAETIVLSHVARDRTAFARGALTAAKWVAGRRGWFTMKDVLGV